MFLISVGRPAVRFSRSAEGGAARCRAAPVSPDFGGDSEGETPLPIPNRAVKPLSADGTWPARARESRSPPFSYPAGRQSGGPLFCACRFHAAPTTVRCAVARATKETNRQIAVSDPSSLVASQPELAEALGLIQMLAEEIGPRRPCSEAEKDAANRLSIWLRDRGVDTRIEEFRGFPSFAA